MYHESRLSILPPLSLYRCYRYSDGTYSVSVARSASILGPYTKLGSPILRNASVTSPPWQAPGHCSGTVVRLCACVVESLDTANNTRYTIKGAEIVLRNTCSCLYCLRYQIVLLRWCVPEYICACHPTNIANNRLSCLQWCKPRRTGLRWCITLGGALSETLDTCCWMRCVCAAASILCVNLCCV